MTYAETIDFLFGIRLFGQKLGLDTMRELLRRLGNPERDLQFIHIAGTNGKGSVAAMCHSVLAAAGYKTALYTSPHLVSFCERFQINGVPTEEADVVRLVERLRPVMEAVAADPEFRAPTFFEVVTALALLHFQEQRVEVVVWETGLGGRLDATNVVTPLVSVITNIAFDHMQYLGDTLEKIAAEKCGIIKPGVPVVTAAVSPALQVIREHAGARLIVVGESIIGERVREDESAQHIRITGTRQDYGTVAIPLLGQHQVANCATAVAALEASGLDISFVPMRAGLLRTRWPGRFQIVRRDPVVILDGAHNAAAAVRLAESLLEHYRGRKIALVLGVLRDKNYDEMCGILAPLAGTICCTRVNSERTSEPGQLAGPCRAANPAADVRDFQTVAEAFDAASAAAEVIVVTGSLFLVGEAMSRLGLGGGRPSASPKELILQ
jgi:dihydrofolate synthase/folylpolyglutamate synthase